MTNENFRLIVRQYEKLVFSVCFQFTGNYHEAENLAQETFISAFDHIDGCSSDKYKPWLCRIAANKAKDWLKTSYNSHVELTKEGEVEGLEICGGIQPEKSLMETEGIEGIHKAVENLKEPYKTVAMMYLLEEKTYDEIAFELERPPKTVQTQVLRAKKILRSKLKGDV